ncbi:hypothetical protein C8R43DRAFT_1066883 [Mycena crocata]|nr:hypothetical protein C8R43DRAFT_1066883 [Mycena crocata]
MFLKLGALFQRALALVVLCDVAYSQSARTYDPSPFNFIGTIDDMTLEVGGDVLAGGSITVNGLPITVPKNLLVTLPSITVSWSELFQDGRPNLPLLGSVSWEATVFGNVVNGERIAGLVYITQEIDQFLQGFITHIDYPTGHFFVDNMECVLNDPLGRFGHAYTKNPLWTVDADNPSVRATTGFPLCIPRNTTDSECPLTNRPKDGNGFYLTRFTFPDPALVSPGGLDPRIMVPLVEGDYITFMGIKTADGVLEIYSLEGNLGIYTAPGTKPAYLTVEAAQYGVIDPNPTLETGETRATALATDPSTTIEWYAIDVDVCTGQSKERSLQIAQPDGGAPVGRTVFRLGKVDASPVTREVGFRYSRGTSPGPRGIIAGQFVQPIFEFIFPELISFGADEVPNQFDLFPYLARGSGPFEFGNYLADPLPTPTLVGQLSPWPGNLVPASTSCAPPSSSSPTSSSASASASASSTSTPPGPDRITLLSATAKNQKGMTMTTATASTSSLTAQLFMAITGKDNVSPQPMINLGGGQFTLTISTKGKPSSVTITSSELGNPVTQSV